jgi:hypothetical protein
MQITSIVTYFYINDAAQSTKQFLLINIDGTPLLESFLVHTADHLKFFIDSTKLSALKFL